ncbi:hypothetical protein LCGC14_1341220 [marine sediment metagenome]|uniref:Uncharacterized protein n=1 Tax=marine sediment metagenome TaxID=412755 RepID=A0A0F9KEF7_9ZZZZ
MTTLIESFGEELSKLAGITPDFMTRRSYGPNRKMLRMPPAVRQGKTGWTKNKYGEPKGSAFDRQKGPMSSQAQADREYRRSAAKQPTPVTRESRSFMRNGTGRTRQGRGKSGALNMRY